jgi:hypothetical protein
LRRTRHLWVFNAVSVLPYYVSAGIRSCGLRTPQHGVDRIPDSTCEARAVPAWTEPDPRARVASAAPAAYLKRPRLLESTFPQSRHIVEVPLAGRSSALPITGINARLLTSLRVGDDPFGGVAKHFAVSEDLSRYATANASNARFSTKRTGKSLDSFWHARWLLAPQRDHRIHSASARPLPAVRSTSHR